MDSQLQGILKRACKQSLLTNTRFHDFAHALEVLENVKEILRFEKGDEDILFASALFHDLSKKSGDQEGIDGAKFARQILQSISEFPQNKINDVCRLIESINRPTETQDELIINEADRMSIFSKLSIVRAFMIYGQQGIQPQVATEKFLEYIEKKYNNFKISKAKELVKKDYEFIKKLLIDINNKY